MKLRWRYGIIAGIFLAIFCSYPQLKMAYLRGSDWNGHYAYNDIDEVAYASYVKALIDGRPRKNDPYSGKDSTPDNPQPESLFSIQFAAPYTIAIPARVLGIGAPWAMTLSGAIAGFLTALAAFWLFARMFGNNWFAMAASLAVFAGGALAAGEGALPELLFDGFSYPYFPGFRRYIPALAMPAIFAMFGFMWKLLAPGTPLLEGGVAAASADGVVEEFNDRAVQDLEELQPRPAATSPKQGWELAMISALACFAYCVFSYFFIWTTAAAWLGAIGLMWIAFRPDGFKGDLKTFAVLAGGCIAVLLPYAYLLSQRSPSMDDVQLLVLTHAPDLARVPEYLSIVSLVLLAIGVVNGVFKLKDRATLFTLATSLVPLIVFNQQIVTGRSLQPIHYQVFIGNYVAGLALMMSIGMLVRRQLLHGGQAVRFASVTFMATAVVWGFVECHYTVRVLDDANVVRDEALPVARRLEQLAGDNPERVHQTVLSFDGIFADDMPTVAPQNVLWSRHQHVFAGLTWQENKERYYRYLYYSGVDEQGLDRLLKKDFVSQIALFGWGRHSDRLSSESKPLTYGEIAVEARNYGRFVETFSLATAADPPISYVVVNSEYPPQLDNLVRWYELHDPETIGTYTLYKARLRE